MKSIVKHLVKLNAPRLKLQTKFDTSPLRLPEPTFVGELHQPQPRPESYREIWEALTALRARVHHCSAARVLLEGSRGQSSSTCSHQSWGRRAYSDPTWRLRSARHTAHPDLCGWLRRLWPDGPEPVWAAYDVPDVLLCRLRAARRA